MKIGINSRIFLEMGTGVPNYVANLYRKCLELDRANEYIFYQPNQSRTLGPTETISTLPGPPGAALFDTLQVRRLIQQTRPDVFHGPAHILPLQKVTGVKYVVTIHDLAIILMPSQYDWKLRRYYNWMLPRSLKLADAIVAVSHNTKRDIVRLYGIPEERVQVIHLGVANRFFAPVTPDVPRLIAHPYFLSITTHPKRKNITGALKAFAKFKIWKDLKYVIAGVIDRQQREDLIASASQLGLQDQIVLFGYANEQQLTNLFRNAEFFIYPSFYEGFGLPVLESMASGCPVIASNTSSLPEIMPNKQWLVDPYDPNEMAEAMQRMLTLPESQRHKIVKENEDHARNFTWDKTALEMVRVFERLTNGQGKRSTQFEVK